MEVLHSGYHIPFHHLPPVNWEPLEFLSYDWGSLKTQTLQEEVIKIVREGALEEVEILQPAGLCSESIGKMASID